MGDDPDRPLHPIPQGTVQRRNRSGGENSTDAAAPWILPRRSAGERYVPVESDPSSCESTDEEESSYENAPKEEEQAVPEDAPEEAPAAAEYAPAGNGGDSGAREAEQPAAPPTGPVTIRFTGIGDPSNNFRPRLIFSITLLHPEVTTVGLLKDYIHVVQKVPREGFRLRVVRINDPLGTRNYFEDTVDEFLPNEHPIW